MSQVIDISVDAGADLSSNQFHPVRIDSSGQLQQPLDGEPVDGILQNKPAAAARSGSLRVAGESLVVAGASFTAGDELASNSVGRATTATSGDEVFAVALEDASGAGSIVRCYVKLRGGQAS